MARIKRGVTARARHKKVLKLAKGYRGRHSKAYKAASHRLQAGLQHAYADRRLKKRDYRALWIQRINAGVRPHGMSYSTFMDAIHKRGVQLNRKTLADLATNHPEAFKAVVDSVKK